MLIERAVLDVELRMLRASQRYEIGGVIVGPVAIDVMDDFVRSQAAPIGLFPVQAVFKHITQLVTAHVGLRLGMIWGPDIRIAANQIAFWFRLMRQGCAIPVVVPVNEAIRNSKVKMACSIGLGRKRWVAPAPAKAFATFREDLGGNVMPIRGNLSAPRAWLASPVMPTDKAPILTRMGRIGEPLATSTFANLFHRPSIAYERVHS